MTTFNLQDTSGKYVLCTVVGRHVDNPLLTDHNEIVIFCATVLDGMCVWVYDQAHIEMLRSGWFVPPCRVLIEIGTKSTGDR